MKNIASNSFTRFFHLVLLAACWVSLVQAEPQQAPVTARFVTGATAIPAGESFRAGILFTIQPGWHIYYKNPGETGLPTRVSLAFSDGAAAGELRWPVPVQFSGLGDVVGYGYSDELLLSFPVQVSAEDAYGKMLSISGNVQWLACGETLCVPGRTEIDESLIPGRANTNEAPAVFARWEDRLPAKISEIKEIESLATEVQRAGDRITLKVVVDWKELMATPRWIPDAVEGVIFGEPRESTAGSTTTISIEVQSVPGSGALPDTLTGLLTYHTPAEELRGTAVHFKLQ